MAQSNPSPSELEKGTPTSQFRYDACPEIMSLITNNKVVEHFVFSRCGEKEISTARKPAKVMIGWETRKGPLKDALDVPEDRVARVTREFSASKVAEAALDMTGSTPKLWTNTLYNRWSRLRGANSCPLPGELLSNLASAALLENGYAGVHCSAVEKDGAAYIFIAPSNTGKTTTAFALHKGSEFNYMCEDMAITDGRNFYGCPATATGLPAPYPPPKIGVIERARRQIFPIWQKESIVDVVDTKRTKTSAARWHLVFLSRGEPRHEKVESSVASQRLILNNRLEFRYHTDRLLLRSWATAGRPNLNEVATREAHLLDLLAKNAESITEISAPRAEDFTAAVRHMVG